MRCESVIWGSNADFIPDVAIWTRLARSARRAGVTKRRVARRQPAGRYLQLRFVRIENRWFPPEDLDYMLEKLGDALTA